MAIKKERNRYHGILDLRDKSVRNFHLNPADFPGLSFEKASLGKIRLDQNDGTDVPLAQIPDFLTGKDADTVDGFHHDQSLLKNTTPEFQNIQLKTLTGSGQLLYSKSDGELQQSSKLVWDTTNSRLGIGTAAPTRELDIVGRIKLSGNLYLTGAWDNPDPTMRGRIYGPNENAYIKINHVGQNRIDFQGSSFYFFGTMRPQADLAILRTGDATSTATQKSSFQLQFENSLWNGSAAVYRYSYIYSIASTVINLESRLAFLIHDGSLPTPTEKMCIMSSSGNVGIGTSGPTEALVVAKGLDSKIVIDGTGSGTKRARLRLQNTDSEFYTELEYYWDGAGYSTRLSAANDLSFGSAGIGNINMIIKSGRVGIGTTSPSALLDINSNILRLRTSKTPASPEASGNAGDICWDSNYIYVCVATDTWKRVAIATW